MEWSGKLSYDFRGTSGNGAAVCAGIRQIAVTSPDKLGKVSLWVCGDLSKQSLVVDLRDAKRNHFVYSSVIDWFGWRRLEWSVDKPERVYRERDGKPLEAEAFVFPITNTSIMVAKRDASAILAGAVYLSEFAATIEGPAADWDLADRVPAPQTERPAFPLQPKPHMEIVNGRQALIVDGKPFIVNGAHCDIWRAVRQDKKMTDFLDIYKEAGATTMGMDVLWSKIEPREDEYDFSFLDWGMRQAEARGLKLALQLYLSDVCGKSMGENEGHVPAYVLSNPQRFARIYPPGPFSPGILTLCPNNPNMLERVVKVVRKLAEYLRDKDTRRTAIMLQLNNETGGMFTVYLKCKGGGWICECPVCQAKKARLKTEGRLEKLLAVLPEKFHTLSENRGFTTMSFADEARLLSDEVAKIYDIPLYLNSPGWPPDVTTVFLATCPNVDLVGADSIVAANENELYSVKTDYLSKRNAYFAAEAPTEDPKTIEYLADFPTFSAIRGGGIGALLWECYVHSLSDDKEARPRYRDGVRPLAGAMTQILETRGTPGQAAWYVQNESAYCNDVPGEKHCLIDASEGLRTTTDASFSLTAGGRSFKISDTRSGVIAKSGENEFAIATGKAGISFESAVKPVLEDGAWDGKRWIKAKDVELSNSGKTWSFRTEGGRCLRLSFGAPAPTPEPEQPPAYLELDVFNNWAQVPGSEFDAIVSARALQDLPASSVSVELPPGWTAKGPNRLAVPALKKGELFTGKVRYSVPANAKTGELLPLEAKLRGASDKALAKTGTVLYTAAGFPKSERALDKN
jgi:hypothetical protein